ncbi:MAG TPA: hypothetical protein VN445_14420 [Rectinemataceae bacterium]|nr:hypothetical protein [Rectinemataceae bacterium]
MDLSRFSIDAALFSGADASNAYRSIFYERLLAGLFEENENLFVRTDIQKEREQIFGFPALYWLTHAGHETLKGKALYLCCDEASAMAARDAAFRMADGLTGTSKPILLGADNAGSEEVKNAQLLYAAVQTFHDLIPTGAFVPRDYGFVIADQAELMAEMPGELLRKLQGSLLPSWERKTLVIANKHTPRAKNFAWDFADNPKEIKLGETMGYAGTTSTISRDIAEENKLRFILKLLQDGTNRHLCVFCNLKSMAAELSARFALNGVEADYIAGNLNPDRKNQIVSKALTWKGKRDEPEPAPDGTAAPGNEGAALGNEAVASENDVAAIEATPTKPLRQAPVSRFPADSFVLVLTDDGAKGLNRPEFLTVVNYDIPLEPEFYFERLNFLKRQDPEALLYNLVCERYMYGIPAIQRMVDASLSVAPLDAGIELPKDLSAGQRIEMPEPRFRGRFDRRGRDDRPDRGDRLGGDDRGEPAARDGRLERGDQREAPRDEAPRSQAPRSEAPRGAGRRDSSGVPRQNRPRLDGSPTGASPRDAARSSSPAGHLPTIDPYAMSMEERMALYKKKYGKRVEQTPASNGGRGDPRRKGRPESERRGPEHRGPERGNPDQRGPERRRGQETKAAGAPNENAMKAKAPIVEAKQQEKVPRKVETPATSEKPRGFFGKLQDLFGTHKD